MAKLTAFLSLDAAAFQSGIKGAKAAIDRMKGSTLGATSGMSKGFASIGAASRRMFAGMGLSATAAAAGIAAAAKSAIDAGGELSDMMGQTGADGRKLVILQQAFKNVGVDAGKVPRALNRMQKALNGVNEDGESTANAFSKLGLSARELQNMDAVDAFRMISETIGAIPDPAKRSAAAMEIFGRSGAELLAMMTDSSAWQAARDQVGTFGDNLAQNAARLDEIGDSIANYQNALKNLGTVVAVNAAPALEWLAEAVQAVNNGMMDFRNPFNSDMTGADRDKAGKMAGQWAKDDQKNGRSRTEDESASQERKNAEFWARKEAERQDAITKAAEKTRQEQEKSAEAAAKKAQEQEKTKAAALDEYRIEAQIVQARIEGNAAMLEKLEREKKIREEMAKLEGAGFTKDEARKGATLMVDKTTQAEAAEKARKDSAPSANSGQLGAFAQSMNVLFGRSANTGLLEENKRQTEWLKKIHDNTKTKDAPKGGGEAVFA